MARRVATFHEIRLKGEYVGEGVVFPPGTVLPARISQCGQEATVVVNVGWYTIHKAHDVDWELVD